MAGYSEHVLIGNPAPPPVGVRRRPFVQADLNRREESSIPCDRHGGLPHGRHGECADRIMPRFCRHEGDHVFDSRSNLVGINLHPAFLTGVERVFPVCGSYGLAAVVERYRFRSCGADIDSQKAHARLLAPPYHIIWERSISGGSNCLRILVSWRTRRKGSSYRKVLNEWLSRGNNRIS
ncbi:MAG: hypothetical protein BWY06_03285 [Candidatus Latescibacteria bacterium ADurb.Bin168]|nr:MAG: hypothetical protein BWY06_03285 [Candidatus Latescibacteria bacterium ADurb.Bin168]